MAYGSRFYNPVDGGLVFNEKRLLPFKTGKGTLSNVGTMWTYGGWNFWFYTYSFPNQLANQGLACTLPDDGVTWYNIIGQALAQTATLIVARPSSYGSSAPEAPEVYSYSTVPPGGGSGSTYGYRTYSESGQILADLSFPIIGFYDIIQVSAFSSSAVPITNTPPKPAFILWIVQQISWSRIGTSSQSRGNYYQNFFRRSGTNVYGNLLQTDQYTEDAVLSGTNYSGTTSFQAVPIFNAAAYD